PKPGHYLANIYQLARLRLQALGIEAIHGGGWCTVSDSVRFYSYRRDGQTGRFASLIWIETSICQKTDARQGGALESGLIILIYHSSHMHLVRMDTHAYRPSHTYSASGPARCPVHGRR